MKERPILFQGAMVRALLADLKTQTRRVVKPQPEWENRGIPGVTGAIIHWKLPPTSRCPYGSRLWVRETWAAPHAFDHLPPRLIPAGTRFHYRASEEAGGLLWRPSIHMPRWASRITLEVTGVRVERLQDISEADAKAEGCSYPLAYEGPDSPYRTAYARLWESINGVGGWDANPWVWVISFRRNT